MANRVVHFEIEAKDSKRASKFYSKAFGWDMQVQGKEFGDYIVAVTGDTKEPGGINGGIYPAEGKKKVNAFRCVIGVDDVKKAIKAVEGASGKVTGKPQDIPGIGIFVSCLDTEGNQFTMLQPSPMMQKK